DQLAHVGRDMGGAAISSRESYFRQLAQMARRRLARRDDFLRILVAQFVQRKDAALRDRDRLREQRRRIDRRKGRARAQVPLSVGKKRMAAFGKRLTQTNRGNRVLQRAPRACMHVDVTGGDLRQSACLRKPPPAGEGPPGGGAAQRTGRARSRARAKSSTAIHARAGNVAAPQLAVASVSLSSASRFRD